MYIPPVTPADLDLLEQFEAHTLPNGAFRHRQHVQLTWIYLTRDPADAVAERLRRSLLALAASHGVAERFHVTLTVAWVRLVDAARRDHPELGFEALVDACPWLLDKDAPLAFYSRERLYSDDARKRWIEPDVQPLPGAGRAGLPGQARRSAYKSQEPGPTA